MNLKILDKDQRKAVTTKDQAVRVIAGAGSGKTKTLTTRIAWLVEQGVKPDNILAFTFTRNAAGEMKERLRKLVKNNGYDLLTIGTFHSVCLSMLRKELPAVDPAWKWFNVLDENKRKYLLKEIIGPKGLNYDMDSGPVSSTISRAKRDAVLPHQFKEAFQDIIEEPVLSRIATVYGEYETKKQREKLMDFDDFLLRTYLLFKANTGVLKRYQNQYLHILTDEVQDNAILETEIVRMLYTGKNNIFVVGDEDQSIFGFRGAHPEIFVNMEKHYKGLRTITLKNNYRSGNKIIEIANKLITLNIMRNQKVMNPTLNGGDISIIKADDQEHEGCLVAEEVKEILNTGSEPRDIAVLYRTNYQSRAIEDAFIKAKIPYVVIGSLGFYGRREIKDMVAYLQLVHNTRNDDALRRVINVPSRYLGKAFMAELERKTSGHIGYLFLNLSSRFSKTYMGEKAREFKDLIEDLKRDYGCHKTIPKLIGNVRAWTDYDHYISEDEEPSPDDSRLQNLDEMEVSSAKFSSLGEYLAYIDMVQKQQGKKEESINAVNLLTLHRAKGLEFKTVFITGLSQGLLPHTKSLDGEGKLLSEEERRLCYVGVTRAMHNLYLSYLQSHRDKILAPSQFLAEMGLKVPSTEDNNHESEIVVSERGFK